MNRIRSRTLPKVALAAALVAVPALVLTGGSATAGSTGDATITMELGKRPKFVGSDTVAEGAKLEIVNGTNPRRIGPHTFTIVGKSQLPKTRAEKRACFNPGHVCLRAARAHEVNFETFAVGRKNVDDGKKGWDKKFGRKGIKGDSWYTEKKDSSEKRTVKAEAGRTLYYMCIVHLGMQGQIEVTE